VGIDQWFKPVALRLREKLHPPLPIISEQLPDSAHE
jgi:hypothetical protein